MRFDDAGPRTWLLAAVAGWGLLAWLLALAGMGGRAAPLDADPALLKPLPPLRASAAPTLGPSSQYGEIAARPLFSEDRKPKPFFLQGGGESETGAFDYLLTSVLITPGLQMAILQPADGSESVRVKLGDVPESHPAWRLTSLDARSAVFEGPEGPRTMQLRVFDGSGGQPPTASGTAAADNVPPAGKSVGDVPPASVPKPAAPPRASVPPVDKPATPPDQPVADTPMTEQGQMEAIRQRIEARRAQLRQQQQAPATPPKPVKSP